MNIPDIGTQSCAKSMSVCFLSFTHPYDDTRVFHKEAISLAQAGYQVTHLAPGTGNTWTESAVTITTFEKRRGMAGTLAGVFAFMKKALALHADCYHCNEMESWVIGCLLKVFRPKALVVFDVHEHYPSRASEPHFPRWFRYVGGPIVRFLYAVLPPITDFLIYAKRSVAPDFKGCESKSEYIFNYAPLRMQGPISGSEPPGHAGGAPIAIHIGSMSRARGWPQLLQALSLTRHKDLVAVLLGTVGGDESEILLQARTLGVAGRVQIKPSVGYGQVFEHLKAARMGLMLYQPGILNHTYAFPIKMYDYMLAGLPIIGPDFSIEVEPIVREVSCGLLIDTSKPEQIASAMDWLYEHPDEASEMGRRGRRAVFEKYNWELEKDKLLNVYKRLSAMAAGARATA